MTIHIRAVTVADVAFLWEMLYHAIYTPPGAERPPRHIVTQPNLAQYVQDFGQREGDRGVVAEADHVVLGAAWARLMHGYGFVNEQTPELTIAVRPEVQGQGIGTQLLTHLCAALAEDFEAVSLSVTWENPARRLYERSGFVLVTLEDNTAILIKRL